MKPFRYLLDPLFLACVALYAVNRLAVRPVVHGGFAHAHFNDLICIPFWVPIMLYLMKLARLRTVHLPPQAQEVIVPLLIWSVLFEVVLPRTATFGRVAVADPRDVFYYVLGALLAALWWRWWYRGRSADGAETGPGRAA